MTLYRAYQSSSSAPLLVWHLSVVVVVFLLQCVQPGLHIHTKLLQYMHAHTHIMCSFLLHTISHTTGPAVVPSYISALIKLTRKARRFFPPGAIREIVNHLAPALGKAPQAEGFMAQGMLVLLLPCSALRVGRQSGGDDKIKGGDGSAAQQQQQEDEGGVDHASHVDPIWSTVLPMVLTTWPLVMHCPWWDSLWLGFLARCVFCMGCAC